MEPSTTATVDELVASVVEAKLPSPSTRRRLREQAGISAREAAAALGVTPLSFLRWERGDVRPRRGHAIAYRRFLDALETALDAAS